MGNGTIVVTGPRDIFGPHAEPSPNKTKHAASESAVPFSTGERVDVVDWLDVLHSRLSTDCTAEQALAVATELAGAADSTSVEEKYRIGELLSRAIGINVDAVMVLSKMAHSRRRQVRFTAARCLSKLVENHPELVEFKDVLHLLNVDRDDRSTPNLVVRALGKGKSHPHIRVYPDFPTHVC